MKTTKPEAHNFLGVPIDRAQEIADYLTTRPYGEVAGLIEYLKAGVRLTLTPPAPALPEVPPPSGEDTPPENSQPHD